MGGGDLNTKKSWHPSTFKNQERVWKAEQADAAEKRKLAELQHEINEERNREELKSIAKKSGLIADTDGDRKLEWMYKGPQVNREEYLLGRTVDKTFEQLDAQEKAGPSVGISQPKNHVEHECIPFSIRQYKGLESTEQVDMTRKLMEDPLMAIKQKEVESRQKILENPVKLKELHRLLKSDRSIHGKRDKDRKHKAKKKKRTSSSTGESDTDDEDRDLDKILAEKYKKVQHSIDAEQGEEVSLNKLLSMKYQKLSKELNKLAKPKKSKKKKKKRGNSSSGESDSDSRDVRRHRRERSSSRDKYRSGPSRARDQSSETKRYHDRSYDDRKSRKREESKRDRHRSRSRDRKHFPAPRRDRSRSRDRNRKQNTPPSSSTESSPEQIRRKDDSDGERRPTSSRHFGLVSASGKKLELSKRDEVRLYKRDEIKAHQSSQKPAWKRPERKNPLTEEEIEAKRKAMLQNAEWRDNERQKNVRRYEDEDRQQEQKDKEKKYDKDFLTKQFKHAASNETVEKRIKSNRNNIQRTGGAMNDNFARR
ncbi:pre-mRNA-splicing factor CWC25 homolog [Topomyia yanbarensis]|uniref:pre-mRNA-splicing factor CWC25 homolog n=1 Tax=Topomyia yanbarensis TaxID=2498891 RepID=UPI00273BCFBF|nr:pre-mRNA-splicing factor CWC25 homolog [Topomyia yanbarensis]